MCSSPTYVYSREINLKIKVVNEEGKTIQKAKIGIDRDTTTFDKLKNHLTKTLKLKSQYMLKYQMRKSNGETSMVMTDDWDLDVALQQCRHSLNLLIQTHGDHTAESNTVPEMSSQDNGQKSPTNGVTSILDRLIDKIDDWFSFNGPLEGSPVKSPMTFKEFQNYLDVDGRLVNYQGFRESVYLGGIAPSLRKIAWRHLLCVFPDDMTANERTEYLKNKSEEYLQLKEIWKKEYKNADGAIPEQLRFVTTMVKKDVVRTDRNTPYYKGREDNKHTMSLFDLLCTYAVNHPKVSYCQGMCDLASPLLAIQDNEAHAYILFCSLMQRMKYNFSFDSIAISIKFAHLTRLLLHFDPELYSYLQEHQVENLLFAYRWLLLEMKREFSFEDSCYFTETMWSSLPTLPSSHGVPLFDADDTTDIHHADEHHLDSDAESLVTTASSALSDFRDCGNLSGDHSLIAKQECIERALIEDVDTDTVFRVTSPFECDSECASEGKNSLKCDLFTNLDIEAVSECQQCRCNNLEVRRQSLDSETAETYSNISSSCGHRPGSNSVDSGFGSRPASPARHESTSLAPNHALTEEASHIFPPPKEFGYGNPFLMFAALAMILEQRDLIMSKKMDFNDIVMMFSGYKNYSNVHSVLKEAKQLYEAYITGNLETDEEDFEHLNIPNSS